MVWPQQVPPARTGILTEVKVPLLGRDFPVARVAEIPFTGQHVVVTVREMNPGESTAASQLTHAAPHEWALQPDGPAGDEAKTVMGDVALHRVSAPERCSLRGRQERTGRPVFSELRAKCNGESSTRTVETTKAWMAQARGGEPQAGVRAERECLPIFSACRDARPRPEGSADK